MASSVCEQVIYGLNDGCIDKDTFSVEDASPMFPKGYRLSAIEGAGHFVHFEAPRRFNELVTEWVNEHGGVSNAPNRLPEDSEAHQQAQPATAAVASGKDAHDEIVNAHDHEDL